MSIDGMSRATREHNDGPGSHPGYTIAWPETKVSMSSASADCSRTPASLSWRLERLTRAAFTSRGLAREYLRAAASFIAAARGMLGAVELQEARHAAARDRQLRARKSMAFIVLCRRRATRLNSRSDDLANW
ncbi:MAG: hypothetical protein IPK78_10010 [Rhodospirillales bacterium]|nr:hypothetical protein [Rhodospirillales bacterium]